MNFKTLAALGAVLALGVACGDKDGDSAGDDAAGGSGCEGYISAITECYAEAGIDLSDAGIDSATYCDTYDPGDGSWDSIFDCYTDAISGADCSTAEGINAMSTEAASCAG